MRIIQGVVHQAWDDDEQQDDWTESMDTSLLQVHATPCSSQPEVGRRQTTGLVAHTQWPTPQLIRLEDLIEAPTTVMVDFPA